MSNAAKTIQLRTTSRLAEERVRSDTRARRGRGPGSAEEKSGRSCARLSGGHRRARCRKGVERPRTS